jgi:hypothetical protein
MSLQIIKNSYIWYFNTFFEKLNTWLSPPGDDKLYYWPTLGAINNTAGQLNYSYTAVLPTLTRIIHTKTECIV